MNRAAPAAGAAPSPAAPSHEALVERMLEARRRLSGIAHRTPIATSRALDRRLGCRVFLKCENLQRGGAFKFRGAWNLIAQLPAAERGTTRRRWRWSRGCSVSRR